LKSHLIETSKVSGTTLNLNEVIDRQYRNSRLLLHGWDAANAATGMNAALHREVSGNDPQRRRQAYLS
jgi:hypothetical protein